MEDKSVEEESQPNFFDLLVDYNKKMYRLDNVKDVVKVRDIISPEEWINNEYYSGPDSARLYPFWKKHFIEIFSKPLEEKINEIIITGSTRTGKSTFMTFCFMRILYEYSCYECPQLLFGLMPSSQIVLMYLSLNREIAENTGYGDLRARLDTAQYFFEHFRRNMRKSDDIEWPAQNVRVGSGSRVSHAIGTNMVVSALDESNFNQSGQVADQNAMEKAQHVYNALRRRGEETATHKGIDFSLSILLSSATTSNSFTEQRMAKTVNNPHVYHIHCKLYDVKPKGTYSDTYFIVFIGNDQLDPAFVDNIDDFNCIMDTCKIDRFEEDRSVEDCIAELDEATKSLFEFVPDNFRESFESDLPHALQDISGVAVAPVGRFFTAKRYYHECLDPLKFHPFTQESFILSTGSDIKWTAYLRSDWRPMKPDRERYVHIDQSTSSDKTGISQVYNDGLVNINGEVRPVIGVDFELAIFPPPAPDKIDIAKCRELVIGFNKHFGLRVGKWTYDTFASQEAIQQLQMQGFNADFQSVDRTTNAYMGLADLFYERRIKTYSHKRFEGEFFNLIHFRDRGKIDHPSDGSKDISDSLAGAAYLACNKDSVYDTLRKNDLQSITKWL